MQKQWWKGIKRMLPGALFGGVSVAGINMTVDAPVHDVQIRIDPVINLNCELPAAARSLQPVTRQLHPVRPRQG